MTRQSTQRVILPLPLRALRFAVRPAASGLAPTAPKTVHLPSVMYIVAAARHAIAHGLHPNRASVVEALGIKIVGCDAAIAKSHNDRVVVQPKRKAGCQVNRGTDDDMAQLLGDINPSHPRHVLFRRAAATRKRTVLSRDPDGTGKPDEITAKTIYWIKWPDDGLCYPAYVLPWESFPRFRSKYLVPVDRGLLESVDELPACYDKGHGFAGVWAEGYKDGQRKMNKRVYPIIFFTLEKRFPWGCETGWAAVEDFRVFDSDKEDPQFKASVDHWLAREDRQTLDDELVRLKLMSPPLDREPSTSSSSERGSSPEEPPENGDIDEVLRKAFVDLTECLSSDRGSRRTESPESDNGDGDIGNALLRGANTEKHDRRRSTSRSLGDGTPAGRLNPDEDEDSDIYGDDNVGPFSDRIPGEESDTSTSRHSLEKSRERSCGYPKTDAEHWRTVIPPSDDEASLEENHSEYQSSSSSSEASSRQRVETSEEDDDIRFAEPHSRGGRAGSTSRRIAHAMAHAARQTNSFLDALVEEGSEEVDELSS
ncbi:hypothetical protein LZL87_009124 [Fusarium oxysporum]|nr:hypothetical protein LZL87_009124 [Fusarium oxysporum]